MPLFDSDLLNRRNQRASRIDGTPFLWPTIIHALRDRLLDIRRDMPGIVEIAPAPLVLDEAMRKQKKVETTLHLSPFGDIAGEVLPLDLYAHDALVSWGHLHWVNELPLFLLQCRHALKPDGVFLAAMIGGESLHELRSAIQSVELKLHGGISPRVSPFASLPDMAQLMQNAGFALPVIDRETTTVTYPDLKALVQDLRHAGGSNAIANRHKKFVGKAFWPAVEAHYRTHHSENGRLLATIEIIYLIGWAPHASQQQPKQRGSATHRLADLLTRE